MQRTTAIWTTDLERVTAIVLRYMRTPILLLIFVFAVTVLGMVATPGRPVNGEPTHMSFFHALYFLTYTATTTGFGEIPSEFSEAQRLWAMFSLFISVVAWLYAIGSIFGLIQNPFFRRALAQRRFSLDVSRIKGSFYVLCGFGDTGSLLTRGLSDAGYTVTVIDNDPVRIEALSLRDYPVTMPGLCADAGIPRRLIAAGLEMPNCRGVVAVTGDEGINRKIAVMAHLINPRALAVCRSTSPVEEEFLSSLGTVMIVDPFDTFAKQLSIALHRPSVHTLGQWLVGARGVRLDEPLRPPIGAWIVCGFGRMGRSLRTSMKACGVPIKVIDPRVPGESTAEGYVVGHANARTLREAGVERAVGIVAATNSDSNNLGILLTARALNPKLFLLARQNRHDDEIAFESISADLVMQPSLVTARRMLFLLVSPMIHAFLEFLQEARVSLVVDTLRRLKETVGEERPELWTETISVEMGQARAVLKAKGFDITLGDLMRDVRDRERSSACVPLVLRRWKQTNFLPKGCEVVQPGDQILFCGTVRARRQLSVALNDPYIREYLITGKEEARGLLAKWAFKWWQQRQSITAC
ncbi:MAG: potassium channel family protein [Gammaproteobacteria bacterium]